MKKLMLTVSALLVASTAGAMDTYRFKNVSKVSGDYESKTHMVKGELTDSTRKVLKEEFEPKQLTPYKTPSFSPVVTPEKLQQEEMTFAEFAELIKEVIKSKNADSARAGIATINKKMQELENKSLASIDKDKAAREIQKVDTLFVKNGGLYSINEMLYGYFVNGKVNTRYNTAQLEKDALIKVLQKMSAQEFDLRFRRNTPRIINKLAQFVELAKSKLQ